MRVLYEYCIGKIKKNSKTSNSVMIAIFIAATFFGFFSLIISNYRQFLVEQEITENGRWEAELLELDGEKLEKIKKDASIERIMCKGNNQVTLLPNDAKQKYLYVQNCDKLYWKNMKERNYIIQGRIPNAENEVVVGANFFSENPNYRLGDTITVITGEREHEGEILSFLSPERANESFIEGDKKVIKIVGVIDMIISSAYNGYATYGYLDEEKITKDMELVAYIEMKNPNNIYMDVPRIANKLNITPDEYGEYPYRYNTKLLEYEEIFAPGKFWSSDYPKLYGAGIVLVIISIAIFSYIVKGAFEISAQKSIYEFAILKSVGATPKQIKTVLLIEALLMSILPIILSQVFSYLGARYIFAEYVKALSNDIVLNKSSFSVSSMVGGIALTLMTIIIAALRQSKYVVRSSPIEIIKGMNPVKNEKHLFKTQKGKIYHILACNNLRKNKKLFKTCTVTLSLGLIVTVSFMTIFTVSNINNTQAEKDNYYNVNVTLQQGNFPDEDVLKEIRNVEGINELSQFSMANCAMWILEDNFSDELLQNGGLKTKAAKENILLRDGQYRIPCVLIGLENGEYDEYVKDVSDQSFIPDAIVVNTVSKNPDSKSYYDQKITIPYLDIKSGSNIDLTEKFLDAMDGEFEFALKNVYLSNSMPNIGRNIALYNLPIIVSEDKYKEIIENFSSDRKISNTRVYINALTESGKEKSITKQINAVCDSTMNTSDYYTSSKIERAETRKEMIDSSMLIAYSITGLFAMVGISSVIVAIYNSLYQRKKELAVLRSVGVDMGGLNYLLRREGILLAAKPILICMVFGGGFSGVLLNVQDITWRQFFNMFGIDKIIFLFGTVFLIIFMAYYRMSRVIKKENIIEAIREQNF